MPERVDVDTEAPASLRSSAAFFALAFALSWTPWSVPLLFGLSPWRGLGLLLVCLGGCGPMFGALALTNASDGWRGVRTLLSRLIRFRRAHLWAWVVALALPAAISVVAALATGATAIPVRPALSLWLFVPFLLLFGPIPEEIGWRGYAWPRLSRAWGGVPAALGLGAVWALWHLPLFLLPGFHHQAIEPIGWTLEIVSHAAVLGVLVLGSRGSLGPAVLFHACTNAAADLWPLTGAASVTRTALMVLVGVGALAILSRVRHGNCGGKDELRARA